MGLPYIGGEPFCFELLDGIYQSPFILPAFLYSIGLQSSPLFFCLKSGAFPVGDSEVGCRNHSFWPIFGSRIGALENVPLFRQCGEFMHNTCTSVYLP